VDTGSLGPAVRDYIRKTGGVQHSIDALGVPPAEKEKMFDGNLRRLIGD